MFFINSLHDCCFDGFWVCVLLYADDVVIISPTPEGLQAMVDKLDTYCSTWNLKKK